MKRKIYNTQVKTEKRDSSFIIRHSNKVTNIQLNIGFQKLCYFTKQNQMKTQFTNVDYKPKLHGMLLYPEFYITLFWIHLRYTTKLEEN